MVKEDIDSVETINPFRLTPDHPTDANQAIEGSSVGGNVIEITKDVDPIVDRALGAIKVIKKGQKNKQK